MLCDFHLDGDRFRCSVCGFRTPIWHAEPPIRQCGGDTYQTHRMPERRPGHSYLECEHRGKQVSKHTTGSGCSKRRMTVHRCSKFNKLVTLRPSRELQTRLGDYDGTNCLLCPHLPARVEAKDETTTVDRFDVAGHLASIPYHFVRKDIAAVTSHFNPQASQRRVQCARQFMRQFPRIGMNLFTIEGSLSDVWNIPAGKTAYRVKLDAAAAMFHKEALLNVAVSMLPDRYTRVIWIDSDVILLAEDYADRLASALDIHQVVQGFSELRYLGPTNQTQTGWRSGVGYRNEQLGTRDANPAQAYPGLAWATDRELFEHVGGLYDRCITGGGDVAWSAAVYGRTDMAYLRHWSDALACDVESYIRRVSKHVASVGHVESRGVHLYHGNLKNRQYVERNRALCIHQFDPQRDLCYSQNGTLRWSDQVSPALIKAVRDYIYGRKEDD